jgi:hypothetical protein
MMDGSGGTSTTNDYATALSLSARSITSIGLAMPPAQNGVPHIVDL